MNTSRYFRRPRHRISSQSRTQSPKIRHATEGTLLCRQSITPSIRLRGQWVQKGRLCAALAGKGGGNAGAACTDGCIVRVGKIKKLHRVVNGGA